MNENIKSKEKKETKILDNNIREEKIYYLNGNIRSIAYYGGIYNDQITGEYKEYYESGILKFKRNYKNGIIEGQILEYYENENLKSKVYYLNNNKEGEYLEYYDNGNIKFKINYKNGKMNGSKIEYHKDNQKIHEETIYKDNKKDGRQTLYYKNGTVNEISEYREDKLVEWVKYDEKGFKIVRTKNYKQGQYDILEESNYFEPAIGGKLNQQRFSQRRFIDKKLEGEQFYFHRNGNLKSILNFKNDKLNGVCKHFYEDNKLQQEEYYNSDNKEGEFKYYREDGSLMEINNFKNNELDGKTIKYFPNGNIKSEILYKTGEIVTSKLYKNGEHPIDIKKNENYLNEQNFKNLKKKLIDKKEKGLIKNEEINFGF